MENVKANNPPPGHEEDNRILVISRFGCPPPNRGNRVRMAALLREMRRLGYEVHFAGIRMSAEEKAGTQPLVDRWVWDFERPLERWSVSRLWRSLKFRVGRWLSRPQSRQDLLNQLFCEHWVEEARELQRRLQYRRVFLTYVYYSKLLFAFPDPCLRILDTIDAFSSRWRRMQAAGLEQHSLSYSPEAERQELLRAHRVIAIQNQEAVYFQQLLGPGVIVRTVGHIVEVPNPQLSRVTAPRVGFIGSNHVLNMDGWSWFLTEVWPQIRERWPDAEVWVAGGVSDNTKAARGVRHLGQIPDLADIYRDCPVFINPVRAGSGLKIKTIEALMYGRPIVTTQAGGEGLEEFLDQGMIVADTAEAFAGQLVRLLSDLPGARQLGASALSQVKKYLAANHQAFAETLKI